MTVVEVRSYSRYSGSISEDREMEVRGRRSEVGGGAFTVEGRSHPSPRQPSRPSTRASVLLRKDYGAAQDDRVKGRENVVVAQNDRSAAL